MKKFFTSFYLLLLAAGICIQATAQTRQLRGKVLDAGTKKPLPFVTITNTVNKKASQKTDADGNFTISIDGKATLVFSYVGYKSFTASVSPSDTAITALMETDRSE